MTAGTTGMKSAAKQKLGTILLFAYGIVLGTSTPLLLSRCAGTGGCGSCGGVCTAAVGIVPLVLFMVFKNRIKRAGRFFLDLFHKREKSPD
jgi:hypothetical protein